MRDLLEGTVCGHRAKGAPHQRGTETALGRNYAERKFCEIEGPIPTRIGLRWPSILRLQSRFIFGNKRTNLIGHAQKFQPLLFI